MAERYENGLEIYYPDIPNPPQPPRLQLKDYAGTYFHRAYRNLTLVWKDEALHWDRIDVTWPMTGNLTHVSGEYFLIYVNSATAPSFLFKASRAAEFRIGSDGIPSALGIAAEEEMGTAGRIWFERI